MPRERAHRFAPATAQKNINLAILNDVAVPVPTVEEQDVIIDRLEADLAILAGVRAHATAAELRLEAVDGALLAAALQTEAGA